MFSMNILMDSFSEALKRLPNNHVFSALDARDGDGRHRGGQLIIPVVIDLMKNLQVLI